MTRLVAEFTMRRIVAVGLLAAAVMLSMNFVLPHLFGLRLHPDFTFMWAGARASDPYDIWAVTKAQAWLWGGEKPLAFVYPPSSLPLYFPFGLLPFWTAFAAWTAISIVAFWSASRQLIKHAYLAFLSPHVVLCVLLGQTALVSGSATIWGVTLLRSRPVLAGVCLGLGAALKPQCFFLVPLALLSGRHWKAIAATAGAWLLLALPTLPMWLDWWRVAQQLPGILDRYYPSIGAYGATPLYLAKALGVSPVPFQAVCLVLGLVLVWQSFRSADNAVRVIGLVTGTLLASPYAIRYELAALAPAYVAILRRGTLKAAITCIPMLCLSVLSIVPALAASALTMLLTPGIAASPTRESRHESATKSMV
jgi:hypothetical protein